MEAIINKKETTSEKGILKPTGREMLCQILIFICSKPIVRSIPAIIDITALKAKPRYTIERMGRIRE